MKLNLFEGARRVLRLVQGVWLLGVAGIVLLDKPYISTEYHTAGPDHPFLRSPPGYECSVDSETELESRETPNGTPVWVYLCFQAMRFPNDKMLVPFLIADNGNWFGDTKYSERVFDYARARAKEFVLPPADGPALDQKMWDARLPLFIYGGMAAAIGCLLLSGFALIVGWIVRGFAGVPMRRDASPE